MATKPEEPEGSEPRPLAKVAAAVTAPVTQPTPRLVALLAAAGAFAALAPEPYGAAGAASIAAVAFEIGRKWR